MPQNLAKLCNILQRKDTEKGHLAKKGHLNFYTVGFIKSNNDNVLLLLASLYVPIMGILSHFRLFLRVQSLLFEVFQLLMATNAYKCLEMPTNAFKYLKNT